MDFDKRWLAGFFDGEGSIGLYARNTNRDGTIKYYVLVVSLAQSGTVGCQICDYFANTYGGSVYCQEQDGYKPQWKWNISADKASAFLEDIKEHLFIKRKEADLGIEFQKLENKRSDYIPAQVLAERVKQLKVNY